MVQLGNGWQELLKDEFEKEYYLRLRQYLKTEYLMPHPYRVFPPMEDIFNALRYTDYPDVKAVIIGQDPYHEYGQAHGLAFSVKDGVAIPPSLRNIYAELKNDLGVPIQESGDLTRWAKNGVLLLNDVLTVREGQAGSHDSIGWQLLTTRIVQLLNERENPMVFMLWGAYAKRRLEYITNPNHLVLTAPHPSPLSASRGFFGCCHFSKTNAFLQKNRIAPIDW
ncbi:MAG TPA: uracil-DNA glycosylase [Bacillota bacterium]|nr:uracil-DNA glycosylase [Bacillota bacterium]